MEHFDHDHEHAHSGAHTHSHSHSHPHTHEHSHEHPNSHTHDGAQALAVLQYMLDHNIHHAGELSDIAAQFDGEARHQLLHAVESFDQANGYLSAALELLKGQNKN
ncbi:MAG: hypothetical protein HFF66_07855 [Oscillospiraceae bacterium]|jgi:hypothetical protein|nr:hypothetical protein [Oscillospiraceae bacterium]